MKPNILAMAALMMPVSADTDWTTGVGKHGFFRGEQQRFIDTFDSDVIAQSYTEALPNELIAQCKDKGFVASPGTLPEVVLPAGLQSAAEAQLLCGNASICVVPSGTTLRLEASLNVAAMKVRGILEWTDETQELSVAWLCSGYIVVEEVGSLVIAVKDKKAIVFIKNNRMAHSGLGERGFGSDGTTVPGPTFDVRGRNLRRTWSLLATTARPGDTSIQLMHDAVAMDWRVGDRG
jgi:hypothetical protein